MEERKKNNNLMYTELNEILKHCPKWMIEKLPIEILTLIVINKSDDIKVDINPQKAIYDQEISNDAIAAILALGMNYWYNEEQTNELRNILKERNISEESLMDLKKIFN